MNRRELTKELHKVCKEHLNHSTAGFAYYVEGKGYFDNWYYPRHGCIIPFDENYNVSRISWNPDKCHGISINLIHKNFKTMEPSPERSKTLFWLSDYCRISNEEIYQLIQNIINNA